jgi:guanylate kinase
LSKGLFIVSGPSGAGKDTLVELAIKKIGGLRVCVSHTTRRPRGDEQEGVNYFFVEEEAFQAMIRAGELAEYTNIHGNFYGTSKSELNKAASGEADLLLVIEGDGATQIKSLYPEAILIFVLPPDLETLRRRITSRGEDDPDEIERRIKNVQAELAYVERFDYLVVNGELDRAAGDLASIIRTYQLTKSRVWPPVAEKFRGASE